MYKIKFKVRRPTIISADVILNTTDYTTPFYELHLCFNKSEYNWSFCFENTPNMYSDLDIVKNLQQSILKCNDVSKMKGRKIRVLLYTTQNISGEWIDGWEFAGYGAYTSDKFIDGIWGGPIMTIEELERIVAKRECASEIIRY